MAVAACNLPARTGAVRDFQPIFAAAFKQLAISVPNVLLQLIASYCSPFDPSAAHVTIISFAYLGRSQHPKELGTGVVPPFAARVFDMRNLAVPSHASRLESDGRHIKLQKEFTQDVRCFGLVLCLRSGCGCVAPLISDGLSTESCGGGGCGGGMQRAVQKWYHELENEVWNILSSAIDQSSQPAARHSSGVAAGRMDRNRRN